MEHYQSVEMVTFWIKIRTDVLLALVRDKTVGKGYQ